MALQRRGHQVYPPNIEIGDLVIDTRAQQASRGGKAIALTNKEYAMLEYLSRNTGRVVGRAEIAEHVWDENFDPVSNLIDVYINRLRHRIDEGFPVALIKTRRGAGYILSATPEFTPAQQVIDKDGQD
jgi:two-component system OmpR family response regulator